MPTTAEILAGKYDTMGQRGVTTGVGMPAQSTPTAIGRGITVGGQPQGEAKQIFGPKGMFGDVQDGKTGTAGNFQATNFGGLAVISARNRENEMADARVRAANAGAGMAEVQTGLLPAEAASQNALRASQGRGIDVHSSLAPGLAASTIRVNDANAYDTMGRGMLVREEANAGRMRNELDTDYFADDTNATLNNAFNLQNSLRKLGLGLSGRR